MGRMALNKRRLLFMKLSLAQNISRLRKQNGLTQERLAEALGVSFAAVSKWERGVSLR